MKVPSHSLQVASSLFNCAGHTVRQLVGGWCNFFNCVFLSLSSSLHFIKMVAYPEVNKLSVCSTSYLLKIYQEKLRSRSSRSTLSGCLPFTAAPGHKHGEQTAVKSVIKTTANMAKGDGAKRATQQYRICTQ